MLGPFRIEAYAIASADGMIADETGSIRNSQVRRRSTVSSGVAGPSGGDRAGPQLRHGSTQLAERLRLIMTRKVASLAPHPDNPNARFWNPAGASLEEACLAAGCARGTVAVIGGPEVYSYFLQIGFDDFYLSRAENVICPAESRSSRKASWARSRRRFLLRQGSGRDRPNNSRTECRWSTGSQRAKRR